MNIYSKFNYEDEITFKKLKRYKKSNWTYFVEGEWSVMNGNGNVTFYYAFSLNGKYCYILGGWKREIVAIAENFNNLNIEIILARMLHKVLLNNGPYIDMINDDGNSPIDLDKFGDEYYKK